MFERARSWLRHLTKRGDDFYRALQSRGLDEGAKVARMVLGEPRPFEEGWALWELDTLSYLSERLCNYEDFPAPEECGAVEATRQFIETLPAGRRRELRNLLAILEAGALLVESGEQRRRFTELDNEAADAYLAGWADSSLPPRRAVFQGLKSVCMMGYWSRPETWDGIGYSLEANPGLDESSAPR